MGDIFTKMIVSLNQESAIDNHHGRLFIAHQTPPIHVPGRSPFTGLLQVVYNRNTLSGYINLIEENRTTYPNGASP